MKREMLPNRAQGYMEGLFHPFRLPHFKATMGFEAWKKFWIGELVPVSAGGNGRRFKMSVDIYPESMDQKNGKAETLSGNCPHQEKNRAVLAILWYPKPMSDIETIDISHVKFSSTVFPTKEDMKLWDSLTLEQRKAVELRDEEEGFQSGFAEPCSMVDIIAEAKAEMNGG